MITGLDHVAIAVPDLEAAIKRFCEDFGIALAGIEEVVPAKTKTAFLPLKGTSIELVHPLNGEGAIQGFLDKKGGGIHHICFSTDDVVADMQRLKDKGYTLLSDTPQPGAHNTKVVFIHPKSCGGVLIELAEHPHD